MIMSDRLTIEEFKKFVDNHERYQCFLERSGAFAGDLTLHVVDKQETDPNKTVPSYQAPDPVEMSHQEFLDYSLYLRTNFKGA